MTSVVLVDDEPLIRVGLRSLIELEDDLEVVSEADDGDGVERIVRETTPDVVVMDVRMPRVDGIEATRRLMSIPRPPAVLLVSAFAVDSALLDGLRAGARGFILKSSTPAQLVDAIRTVAAGESIVSPGMTRVLVDQAVHRTSDPAPELSTLTSREREVLHLMATGLSNAEIAGTLVIAVPTVKSHVRHILTKLGLQTRLQAILAMRSELGDDLA